MASSVPDSHGGKALHTASENFSPYVPATESPAEFTLKAVVIGALFGLLFGASTVYLGLRAGLTVSAKATQPDMDWSNRQASRIRVSARR